MYEFSAEEKKCMNNLLQYFIVMGRYKSSAILNRIDENSLTTRDLESIQKKLSLAIGGLGSFLPFSKEDYMNHMEIAKWVSIVDSALARYRIIGWRDKNERR